MKQKLVIKKERRFLPFHFLYHGAFCAKEDALSKRDGYVYDQLNCMLLCAMTVEAIGNSYGEELFDHWKDYEGLPPVSKIRLIAEHFGIAYGKRSEPWSTLIWLMKFRNSVAHPKSEYLNESIELDDREDYQKHFYEKPLGKVEKQVTEVNMVRAYGAIRTVLDMFVDHLPEDRMSNFLSDSWSGGTA